MSTEEDMIADGITPALAPFAAEVTELVRLSLNEQQAELVRRVLGLDPIVMAATLVIAINTLSQAVADLDEEET
jgi:hypothetical protein